MPTDLTTVRDHPAVLLEHAANSGPHPTGTVAAAFLRIYEKDRGVTFAALDNDALAQVREQYEAASHDNLPALVAFRDAVRDLLGLE